MVPLDAHPENLRPMRVKQIDARNLPLPGLYPPWFEISETRRDEDEVAIATDKMLFDQ